MNVIVQGSQFQHTESGRLVDNEAPASHENMVEPTEIDTDRLRLRQWQSADRWPFAALNADTEVMRYFPACLSRSESDALADRCEASIEKRGWGFWAVELCSEQRFIGFVGLNIPEADLPFKPCVEIGWRLARQAWGQGFATEAARASLTFGFEILRLSEVVAFTSIKNSRSRAVMDRLGMVESSLTFEHPAVPVGSKLRKHCLYRISRESWRH